MMLMPAPVEIRAEGDRLVAYWHGERAGHATVRLDGDAARLHVEVDRAHRGLEVGKMLLAAAEARAAGQGVRRAVVLPPSPEGFEAFALRKAGYVPAPEGFVKRLSAL